MRHSLFTHCKQQLFYFLTALQFLSRLSKGRIVSEIELANSLLYLPLIGLFLGFLASLPLLLGLCSSYPFLQSWIYLLFFAYITRGIHYDGLADICDGIGSNKQGEDFFLILKDSRVGVFGCLALCLYLIGQIFLVYYVCLEKSYALLIFTPVWGRSLALLFSCISSKHSKKGLGALISLSSQPARFLVSLLSLFFVLVYNSSLHTACFALLFSGALLFILQSLAQYHGRYNGDFLGAIVLLGEQAFLFSFFI